MSSRNETNEQSLEEMMSVLSMEEKSSPIKFDIHEYIEDKLMRKTKEIVLAAIQKSIETCAIEYKFDAKQALLLLNVNGTNTTGKKTTEKKAKPTKDAFPLPYNGTMEESHCHALKNNGGLFTQCTSAKSDASSYCTGCIAHMTKTASDKPECGTIEDRMKVKLYEYTDAKGRKPIHYTKIMKKLKITQEMVIEEATKKGIDISYEHFIEPENVKRGRPPSKEKVEKPKGVKGRPKKSDKVVTIQGSDTDNLFDELSKQAILEADSDADSDSDSDADSDSESTAEVDAETEAMKAAEAEAKQKAEAEAEAKKKAEAEAKKAAEAEAKKLEAEAKKAEKKAAAEAEKKAKAEAKKLEAETKKTEIEAKKKAEIEAKKAEIEAKKLKAKKAEEAKKTEDAKKTDAVDKVKKINFEGKDYLLSKNTGIVYDYDAYINQDGLTLTVGTWLEATKTVVFTKAEAEEDDEEDSDSDEDSDEELEEEDEDA